MPNNLFNTTHQNYYEILGVNRDDAIDKIKTAYHRQLLQYHPDKYTKDSKFTREQLTQLTVLINEAFRTLKDSQKRQLYDATLPPVVKTTTTNPSTSTQNKNQNHDTTQTATAHQTGRTFYNQYTQFTPSSFQSSKPYTPPYTPQYTPQYTPPYTPQYNAQPNFFRPSQPKVMKESDYFPEIILRAKFWPNALFKAIAKAEELRIIKMIVRNDPSLLHTLNEYQYTPLHLAVIVKRPDIVDVVDYLYQQNTQQAYLKSAWSSTPYNLAAMAGSPNVLSYFEHVGAYSNPNYTQPGPSFYN